MMFCNSHFSSHFHGTICRQNCYFSHSYFPASVVWNLRHLQSVQRATSDWKLQLASMCLKPVLLAQQHHWHTNNTKLEHQSHKSTGQCCFGMPCLFWSTLALWTLNILCIVCKATSLVHNDTYHKTDEMLSHSNQIQRLFFEFLHGQQFDGQLINFQLIKIILIKQ